MSLLRSMVGVLGVVAVVWLALIVLTWIGQRQLIYLPDRSAPTPPADLDVEEVVLTTTDGLELAAWFVPATGEPVATVLVASGNAGNRSLRAPLAAGLVERGHAVLLLDYRGYGGNPGRPHEDGVVADARAAWEHLARRDDVDPERIAFLGESLGSGVLAALAGEHAPAALVLRSPFPSLADVGRRHYPFLPVRTLLRERFPTAQHLEGYDGPVLVVAGAQDRIVPTDLSRELASHVDADYVEVPGAGHNDRALLDGPVFLDAADTFIRDAVGPPPG